PPGPSTLDDEDSNEDGKGAAGEMNALAHSTLVSHNISAITPSSHSVLLSCPSHWNKRTMRIECISHSIGETSLRLLVKMMDGRSPLELKWDHLPSSFTPSSSVALNVDDDARIRLDFCHTSSDVIGQEFVTTRCAVRERPALAYHEARVLRILHHPSLPSAKGGKGDEMEVEGEGAGRAPMFLLRSSLLLIVETDESATLRVPIGHHVELRVRKGASLVSRPYTPVPVTAEMRRWMGEEEEVAPKESAGRVLAFFIKIYDDGVVTPAIERLKRDDLVHISDPIGSIDFSTLPYLSITVSPPPPVPSPINELKRDVVCLAGGTGITPMLGVIKERGWKRCRLIAYNKKEEDTPRGGWMPEGMDMVSSSDRLVHVLSAADNSWKGVRGRIGRENMGELTGSEIVFVCGPDGFVQEAARLLQESGHPTDLVHVFQG
ncbi:hypothetical protein PMAYCL1PPCAC_26075, partial [Pristionchus mayeri]